MHAAGNPVLRQCRGGRGVTSIQRVNNHSKPPTHPLVNSRGDQDRRPRNLLGPQDHPQAVQDDKDPRGGAGR